MVMILQTLTGFPLMNQAENILFLDALKNLIAGASPFLPDWRDY
jgi:hypothetical protein